MDQVRAAPIFDQVVITILPSDDLEEWNERELETSVTACGAEYLPYDATTFNGALDRLTHIVSSTSDFPEYEQALDSGIAVVTPRWIHDSIAKNRQTIARQYSPDPRHFFRDVNITGGTLPESDEDAIVAGVVALGGQWSEPLTRVVTHIVSTDVEHEKCRIAKEKGLPIRIVLPHWFDDCLKLGKKISEAPYELPDPEILRRDNQTPIQINDATSISGATISQPDQLPTMSISPSKSRKSLNAFTGRKLFLNDDLALNDRLKNTVTGLIRSANGEVTDELIDADIYVGRYRDGDNFVDAFMADKVMANLSWLYHVINRNRWTNPKNQLLHYPVPRHGLPGFSDLRVSISNYTGDARTYIQSLVQECGAQFTKSMRQDNTHLITANKVSEKCEAAQEWNIIMVNHLWLEEGYAKCAVQPLADPKYSHFPARTNLGEICGQTAIDESRIEHMFVLPILRQRQAKAEAEAAEQLQIDAHQSALEQEQAEADLAHEESAFRELSANKSVRSAVERSLARRRATSTGSVDLVHDAQTPAEADGKENQMPSWLGSGRASKVKALGALHQQANDIALFQKEMKRKGGVVHGGRVAKEDVYTPDANSSASRKRSSGGVPADEEDPIDKPGKKARVSTDGSSAVPPIKYRMMITGHDRWSGQPQKESRDRAKLRQLGIVLTTEPKNVDILVAKSIVRTRKFVAAIARSPLVVGIDYLDYILQMQELPEDPPLLTDTTTEAEYDFQLAESLERAKANKGRLFKGWRIYVSDHLNGGFDTYKDIITAHGGEAAAFRGNRRGTTMRRPSTSSTVAEAEDEDEFAYFVATDSAADKALWQQFRAMASAQGQKARVVKVDWLLLAALTQRIRWDEEWLWPNA